MMQEYLYAVKVVTNKEQCSSECAFFVNVEKNMRLFNEDYCVLFDKNVKNYFRCSECVEEFCE